MGTHPGFLRPAAAHTVDRALARERARERCGHLVPLEVADVGGVAQDSATDETAPHLERCATDQPVGQALGVNDVVIAIPVDPLGVRQRGFETLAIDP